MKALYARLDDARADAPEGNPSNSELTHAMWAWISDRLAQDDVADAFRKAWEAADERGEEGSRVRAGLAAVAEQVRKP